MSSLVSRISMWHQLGAYAPSSIVVSPAFLYMSKLPIISSRTSSAVIPFPFRSMALPKRCWLNVAPTVHFGGLNPLCLNFPPNDQLFIVQGLANRSRINCAKATMRGSMNHMLCSPKASKVSGSINSSKWKLALTFIRISCVSGECSHLNIRMIGWLA